MTLILIHCWCENWLIHEIELDRGYWINSLTRVSRPPDSAPLGFSLRVCTFTILVDPAVSVGTMAKIFAGIQVAFAELSSDSKTRSLLSKQVVARGGEVMVPRPSAFFGNKGAWYSCIIAITSIPQSAHCFIGELYQLHRWRFSSLVELDESYRWHSPSNHHHGILSHRTFTRWTYTHSPGVESHY